MTFHRPALAADMAKQLLHPKGLIKNNIRSGLFLGGLRRTGKTTFLRGDLIPALEAEGAVVVYVDLWSNTAAKPTDLLLSAVRKTLEDLERPDSKVAGVLRRLKGLDIGAAGFKFGFNVAELGKTEGTTLAGAFAEVVSKAKSDVVVVIDEVQHALNTEDGDNMLLALKAARDEINTKPDTPGYFLFIGTGSHRARVRELTIKGKQAFNGAMSENFPVLEEDFVEWLLKEADLGQRTPSLSVAFECFARLGRRPEELTKALVALQNMPTFSNADQDLRAITEGVRQWLNWLASKISVHWRRPFSTTYVMKEGRGSRSSSQAQRLRPTDVSWAERSARRRSRRSRACFSTKTSSPATGTASMG